MDHLNSTIKILRLKQVQEKTGLSRSGIYERMSNGGFPANINLGGKSVGWLENEVNDWILERVCQGTRSHQNRISLH